VQGDAWTQLIFVEAIIHNISKLGSHHPKVGLHVPSANTIVHRSNNIHHHHYYGLEMVDTRANCYK